MAITFTGITFAEQKVTPSADGIANRAVFPDCFLTGCAFSYAGFVLTMDVGHLMICGRQIRHPKSQDWAFDDARTGFGRLLLTIDLTQTSNEETFDQVRVDMEYSQAADGFPSLEQTDINRDGVRYQVELCVVSIGAAGITGVVSQLERIGYALQNTGHIAVTAEEGSQVSCIREGEEKKAVESLGLFRLRRLRPGTWTVIAQKGVFTASQNVVVTRRTEATVTLKYFRALIVAKYPKGSQCICTDGRIVLTTERTDGGFSFLVPHAGKWTVSATNGILTASETVLIEAAGNVKEVSLDYRKWLVREGVEQVEFSMNGTVSGSRRADGSYLFMSRTDANDMGGCAYLDGVDMTGYSRMVLYASSYTNAYPGSPPEYVVFFDEPSMDAVTVRSVFLPREPVDRGEDGIMHCPEYPIDVTALTGPHAVGFKLDIASGVNIVDWYLE